MKNFKKSFITIALVMVLILGAFSTAFAAKGSKTAELQYNNINVTLDGKEVDCVDANGKEVEPFIIDGTTYLPVRAISNALDLDVDWDPDTKTVVLTSDEGDGKDIAGEYKRSYDGSELVITKNADSSYSVVLFIYRLTCIDDLSGYYKNGKLTVTGTDASGNPITGEITFKDKQAIFTITDTTWGYFKNSDQFIFTKQ